MNYFIDLFSPQTAEAFANSDMTISGFRKTQKTYVQNQNIGPGDRFICYVTQLQRFIGVLEITSKPFEDDSPIFTLQEDPFTLRFKVKTIVWLSLDKSIPIREEIVWSKLSFTKNLPIDSNNWTHRVFSSPRLWPSADCQYLLEILVKQKTELNEYKLNENELKKLKKFKLRTTSNKETNVSVPENDEDVDLSVGENKKILRDSLKIQSKLASIGEKLGYKIWIPKNDRIGVLENWQPEDSTLLDELPLVFDELTLKTIKNIDVLWIQRRSVVRAFEVEDTTSIYSGILRMADLLALQPMLNIKIHIVAPISRKEEVYRQITRPVFAVMEKGPLAEYCSYISYEGVMELESEKRLQHMSSSIVDEYIDTSEI